MRRASAGFGRVWEKAAAWSAAVALVALVGACGGGSSAANTLPGPLAPATGVVGEVAKVVPGLSQQQVAQAMGGILGYAQKKLSPADFSKVASAFPGSNALISEGTRLGMPSEMTGLTSLRGTLQNAGISNEQFTQIVPAMSNIVQTKAGPQAGEAFASVFK